MDSLSSDIPLLVCILAILFTSHTGRVLEFGFLCPVFYMALYVKMFFCGFYAQSFHASSVERSLSSVGKLTGPQPLVIFRVTSTEPFFKISLNSMTA